MTGVKNVIGNDNIDKVAKMYIIPRQRQGQCLHSEPLQWPLFPLTAQIPSKPQ
jgi:hypothetical protein